MRLFCFLTLLFSCQLLHANQFSVITARSNSTHLPPHLVLEEIKQLYLGWKARWDNNQHAHPLSPSAHSEAAMAFRERVLQMTTQDYSKHWDRINIIYDRKAPPEIASERLLVNLVANTKGAFSVVSSGVALKHIDKVRVLYSFD